MKYRCLILDHDDTIVDSTRNVHYPSFCEYNRLYHPELSFTLEEYVNYNFDPGVIPFFKEYCHYTDEELKIEQEFWNEYSTKHVSKAFDGIKEILDEFKRKGGIITVISHSFEHNIIKDYKYNGLPDPEVIYGWDQPMEERKPSPVPVLKIMEKYNLDKKDILILDDLKPGYTMARSAGVDFAASAWCFNIEGNRKFMKENADYYLETVESFRKILEM